MQPLPQKSSSIIHLLLVKTYFKLFSQIYTPKSMIAGHKHIVPVNLYEFTALGPWNPHALYMQSKPGHFLLETAFSDHLEGHLEDRGWKYPQGLLYIFELSPLSILRQLYMYFMRRTGHGLTSVTTRKLLRIKGRLV